MIKLKLYEMLYRHKIKQKQLAEVSNVDLKTISYYARGEREMVSLSVLSSIIEGFQKLNIVCNLNDLLEYTKEPANV